METVLFYVSLALLIPAIFLFIIGTGLSSSAKGSYQTQFFNALAWTGGSQTHHYHYPEQEELGDKLLWWSLVPIIVGIAIYPEVVWWIKILAFIFGMIIPFAIGTLLPWQVIDPLAILLKVKQKPLTLKEQEELEKEKIIYDLVQVVGAQQEIKSSLAKLEQAQQEDFLDCIKQALDENNSDKYRYQCIYVLKQYMKEVRE